MPLALLALQQSARSPHAASPTSDATLRSAIVNVAHYYARMAAEKSPAQMEATIWQHASLDGVDHGESCAAFASLTLELAAQVVGQQSWVTGGTSYPWPLHQWADVRVDPNPASPGITSIRQDAQAHDRWHPLGDGYKPLPGDWVLFSGHVEVVTEYADGVLQTVGGDSLPNFSVNAHEYREPLDTLGVEGFVNNGRLTTGAGKDPGPGKHLPSGERGPGAVARGNAPTGTKGAAVRRNAAAGANGAAARKNTPAGADGGVANGAAPAGSAAIPGSPPVSPATQPPARTPQSATIPGIADAPAQAPPTAGQNRQAAWQQAPATETGSAAIPGISATAPSRASGSPTTPYHRYQPELPPGAGNNATAQRAFISQIAPGAIAAQRTYGIPAAVTIAQAIEESGWGQSELATKSHNLFGIKGKGPAGSDPQFTHEYQDGHWVTRIAWFRAYHNIAESINDHGSLLASSEYYQPAMAVRDVPNAFATALTGVYATDPEYGAKLIRLMREHNLYRYDVREPVAASQAATSAAAASHGLHRTAAGTVAGTRTPPPPGRPFSAAPAAGSDPSLSLTTSAPTASPTAKPRLCPPADVYGRLPHAKPSTQGVFAKKAAGQPGCRARRAATSSARTSASQYEPNIPSSVRHAFLASAKAPLTRAEHLYRDVASHSGMRWELLAACDWMQCEARQRYSPVYGEKLGTVNPDGSVYRTRSAALERCADDMIELALAVYGLDLTSAEGLSIRDLANAFAAFRWGGLLKLHRTSAMEFPYSVAGLTSKQLNMRWPKIAERNTPDKPGRRFQMPFGAVPIVLLLNYPATL